MKNNYIFTQIIDKDSELLNPIKYIYHTSFPEEEMRPWENIIEMIDNGSPFFRMIAVTDNNGVLVGFYTIWRFPGSFYIEHLAIDPGFRGNGIGGKIIAHILEEAGDTPVVLEVELPDANEDAPRRISFYKKCGFLSMDDFEYFQPPYRPDLDEVQLMLMVSKPLQDPKSFVIMLHTLVYNQ